MRSVRRATHATWPRCSRAAPAGRHADEPGDLRSPFRTSFALAASVRLMHAATSSRRTRPSRCRTIRSARASSKTTCRSLRRGTLRGLHPQHPFAQGKLVMVITGAIFDVAVDVRLRVADLRSVGQRGAVRREPSAAFVPPGFAHGFLCHERDGTRPIQGDGPLSPRDRAQHSL